MMQNRPLIIGLTGGSGSGKTTVCAILKKHNAVIIDADEIAHSIIKQGESAYNELISFFGVEILDKNKDIDRKVLGQIVFDNKQKLSFLTKTTHKYIIKEMLDKLNEHKKNAIYSYIVLDAPLLIEANLHKVVDTVWIIDAPIDERIKRLIKRDSLSEEIIRNRLNNQTPFEKNKSFADFIIYNKDKTNLEELINQKLEEI